MNTHITRRYHRLTKPGTALLAVIAWLIAFATAAAQPTAADRAVGVSVEISHQRQYVQSPVEFRIIVSGVTDASGPATIDVPNATVRFVRSVPRSSRFVQFINGQRQESISETCTLVYFITPTQPGEFVVPSITVTATGRSFRTDPVRFTAIPLAEPAGYFLEATLSRERVYVGEPVELTLVWSLSGQASDANFDRVRVPDSVRAIPYQDPRFTRRSRPEQMIAVPIFDDAATVSFSTTDRDGRRFNTATLRATLVPSVAGPLTLGPFEIEFEYPSPEGGRGTLRGKVTSNPLSLTVVPLPEVGRPAGFYGLIGKHRISATIDRDEVNVGDPIELLVTIESDNLFSPLTNGPDLDAIPGFNDRFRVDSDGWTALPREFANRWQFSTTVRPLDESVTEFPSISLPTFDPTTGEYLSARSDPIPITVRETRRVTSQDAVTAGPLITRESLTRGETGPWAIDRDPLRTAAAAPLPAIADGPAFWAAVLLTPPILVAGALVLLGRKASHNPGILRAQRALPRATASLRRARSEHDTAGAILAFVADLTDRPIETVTASDVRSLANRAGLNANEQGVLARTVIRAEFARFGAPGSTSATNKPSDIGSRSDPGADHSAPNTEDLASLLRRISTALEDTR